MVPPASPDRKRPQIRTRLISLFARSELRCTEGGPQVCSRWGKPQIECDASARALACRGWIGSVRTDKCILSVIMSLRRDRSILIARGSTGEARVRVIRTDPAPKSEEVPLSIKMHAAHPAGGLLGTCLASHTPRVRNPSRRGHRPTSHGFAGPHALCRTVSCTASFCLGILLRILTCCKSARVRTGHPFEGPTELDPGAWDWDRDPFIQEISGRTSANRAFP